MLKHADLVPFEGNGEGLDTIDCYEVYRKGNLVLYEYENEKSPYDSAVSEDVVNELFPEFKTDSTKGYLIEEDGKFCESISYVIARQNIDNAE